VPEHPNKFIRGYKKGEEEIFGIIISLDAFAFAKCCYVKKFDESHIEINTKNRLLNIL